MTDAPTFSIITPVFNAGVYLVRTVESALRQTCSDFELILVDDGSTDDAVDGVLRLGDPRIRVLRQANQGGPSAMNSGLEASRGAYIAFLDQDDLWAAEKLARHLETFRRHPEVDLTFTWVACIGELDQRLPLLMSRWRGPITFEELLVENVIGAISNVAIRRAAIEKAGSFDPRLPFTCDLDLLLRVLRLRPANGLAIPEVLTFYRRHSTQMSKDWRALRKEYTALLDKFCSMFPKETAHLRPKADANLTFYCAYFAYERREFGTGCRLLGELFRMHPLGFLKDFRYWGLFNACLIARVLPARIQRRVESWAGIRTFPH
jgi:glycosyltransferase involved in cell wall biosynthesis